MIVKDDEVAHRLVAVDHVAVVFVALDRADAAVGKQREQLLDAVLDQVDAGRFQRLEETRRQADARRHSLPTPCLRRPAVKRRRLRLGDRLAFEVRAACRSASRRAMKRAAIDVAVAGAVLQRDAPLPAGRMRGRARVRQ